MDPNLAELRRLRLDALNRRSSLAGGSDAPPASDSPAVGSDAPPASDSPAAGSDAAVVHEAPNLSCQYFIPKATALPSPAPINFVCIRAEDLMTFMGVTVRKSAPAATVTHDGAASGSAQTYPVPAGAETPPLVQASSSSPANATSSPPHSQPTSPPWGNNSSIDQTSPVRPRPRSPVWIESPPRDQASRIFTNSRATSPPNQDNHFGSGEAASSLWNRNASGVQQSTSTATSSRAMSLPSHPPSDQTSPVQPRPMSPFWIDSPPRDQASRIATNSRATSPPFQDYYFSSGEATSSFLDRYASGVGQSRSAAASSQTMSGPAGSSERFSPVRTRGATSTSWRQASSSNNTASSSQERSFSFLGSRSRRISSTRESDSDPDDPDFVENTSQKKKATKRSGDSQAKHVPKKRGRPPKPKPASGNICPICRESASGKLSNTSCGHFFHEKCLTDWVNTPGQRDRVAKVCPSCGGDFYVMDINPIFL